MPKISIGIASGSLPASTVQAYPFIPGLISASLKIWTFPALGRTGTGAWANVRDEQANATARATNFCIGPSLYFRMRTLLGAVPIIVQIFKEWETFSGTFRATPEARVADRCDPGCSRRRDLDPIQPAVRRAAADGPAPAAALSCPPSASV